MKVRSSFAVGMLLLMPSCSMPGRTNAPAAGTIQVEPGGAQGFQHGIERSSFAIGESVRHASEHGFHKVIGSYGTFGVDTQNGAALAIQDAQSPDARKLVWYTGAAADHNAEVVDYFVHAGIPERQMGTAQALSALHASGGAHSKKAPRPIVSGYQSVVPRVVNGIPVVDSVAWARLDDRKHVLAECVYWPALPAAVIKDAERLRTTLSSEAGQSDYRARLRSALPAGQVVIRHSSLVAAGPFMAIASYDVNEPVYPQASAAQRANGTQPVATTVRHFDSSGHEFRLPQELRKIAADFPEARRMPGKR